MKASYAWLKELLPALSASPDEVAAKLTGAGLEVEAVHEYGRASDACVVARVVSLRPHPTKSGLRLVTVDRGGGEQEVVCGAPNVPEPGGLVVLAPLGAELPDIGMTIARRAIAGVESEGMLCSESELGLGEGGGGILVLPEGTAAPGTKLSVAVPESRDTVFEIGLTPNRPDGLGHYGLARELAALFEIELPAPRASAKSGDGNITELCRVDVEDAERCPHYGAAAVVDVKVGPSPLAVRLRLQALGVRAISNVVDVTNIVMLETGHPMHAFDLDRVEGRRVVVRRAREGEPFRTLDGTLRSLHEDDLVVCDGARPVALAGVMGGADSEIGPDTRRVLFECATFDPRAVRRAARRHGLHTESSHRFERGVDPADVAHVLERALEATVASAGGRVIGGRLHVQGGVLQAAMQAPPRLSVELRHAMTEEVTGIAIPWALARAILERLGCAVSDGATPGLSRVEPPTHRPDLTRPIDLVEEVIRVYGIDRVPASLPAIVASRDVGGREELKRRFRSAAVAVGLSEAVPFAFTSEEALRAAHAPAPVVRLANPLVEHHSVLRTSHLPGLFAALQHARRHGVHDARLFSVGTLFVGAKEGGLCEERVGFAFVVVGERAPWLGKPEPVDAWEAKGLAEGIVARLGAGGASTRPLAREAAPPSLHPRAAAEILVDGAVVGRCGLLHPDVVEAFELAGSVLACEIDAEAFLGPVPVPRFAPIPRFPSSIRDLALVVPDSLAAGAVETELRAAAKEHLEHVSLFDRFVGGAIPEGHVSLAFRLTYRAPDRTLTDAEIDAEHAAIVDAAKRTLDADMRR